MMELLFGFEGRIGRGEFWAVQVPLVLLAWAYLRYVDRLLAIWIPGSVFMGSALALLIAAPLIWVQYAITIKRCHDRGKTGFWSLLLLLIPVGAGVLWHQVALTGPAAVLVIPLAVGSLWLFIDCGLLPAARNEPER